MLLICFATSRPARTFGQLRRGGANGTGQTHWIKLIRASARDVVYTRAVRRHWLGLKAVGQIWSIAGKLGFSGRSRLIIADRSLTRLVVSTTEHVQYCQVIYMRDSARDVLKSRDGYLRSTPKFRSVSQARPKVSPLMTALTLGSITPVLRGVTRNAWQSPACSPPCANAPAKLRDYWTKVH